MRKHATPEHTRFQRVIVSLPQPLVAELRRFAGAFRGGNKSGFVADAVRLHIDQLRRKRHTAKLRESYAASAADSMAIGKEWEALDEEAWDMIEEGKQKHRKA